MGPGAEWFYIVDAPSLIFQVFFAIRTRGGRSQQYAAARSLTTPDGRPCGAVYGFTQDMLFLLEKKRPTYIACAFDAPGPTFRDLEFEAYKANRPPMPEELDEQWPMIHELLEALQVATFEVPGFEADDICATLARQAEAEGIEVAICTSDKDARQLISEHVRLYDIRSDRFIDEVELQRTWGIRPDQVVDFLTLVGDPIDNVPGVPGIGPKTAAALLQKYGTLDNLLAHLAEIPGKRGAALREWAPVLPQLRTLLRLRTDVPVQFDRDQLRVRPPDAFRLAELFRSWGFRRLEREWFERAVKSAGRYFSVVTHVLQDAGSVEEYERQVGAAERLGVALASESGQSLAAAVAVDGERAWWLVAEGEKRDKLAWGLTLEKLKVVHNLKEALLKAWQAGLDITGETFDPMLGDYLLAPGSRAHALQQLCLRYLQYSLEAPPKTPSQTRTLFPEQTEEETLSRRAVASWMLYPQLRKLLEAEGLWNLYQTVEHPLIRVLARIQQRGIKVDVAFLREMGRDLKKAADEIAEQIYRIVGRRFSLTSPLQLREILFEQLGLPVLRRVQTGPSTDQEVLERLAEQHEVPRLILEHRHLTKMQQYLESLQLAVNPTTGRIHTNLDQTVAATGRLISSEPNLQNIPIRSPVGRAIRRGFVATASDWLLVDADYSQIELRLLAHLSGDESLTRAFREGRDVHRFVAAELAGIPETEVSDELRERAKAINFGVIYGMSPQGLAARTGMTVEEATDYIERYFQRHPGVDEFIRRTLARAAETRQVETILGRKRRISGVRTEFARPLNQPEREAVNTVVQGSAADLIKLAMLRVDRFFEEQEIPGGIVLQIHDELLLDVPAQVARDVAKTVKKMLESAMELSVPLVASVSIGPNWLDQEPLEL